MKNIRWRFALWLTEKATDFSGILLRERKWKYTLEDYRKMPENSIGRLLADYMDRHRIGFKANLVRHDVKHILLGYQMNLPDEMRLCAFLFGNRCYNIMTIAYLFVSAAILPEYIPALRKDFRRGRSAMPLRTVALENYLTHNLDQCRKLWRI